eukprot:7445954-Lingulodinium_polyedra.AAC.1
MGVGAVAVTSGPGRICRVSGYGGRFRWPLGLGMCRHVRPLAPPAGGDAPSAPPCARHGASRASCSTSCVPRW